jgi:epoxyqueuosine reductase QueG
MTPERLLALSEEDFRRHFQGTPLERTGFGAMQRNAQTALDNIIPE